MLHLIARSFAAAALSPVLAAGVLTATASSAAAEPTAATASRTRQAVTHHVRHDRLAARGARVLRVAASKRGAPYRWGATGPRAFDCSGYTLWVYRHVGEHLPRTSAQQARATRHVSHRAARPGDLVFFTEHGRVYHVGIYAGHRSIWHAPHTGARVRRERLWTRSYLVGRVR